MRTSFVGTTLLALLGASAIACGQPTDSGSQAASKNTWSCGSSDVPGGDVVHCTQSALVIDTSITMTDPCEGTTDNPELCTSYTCTAGEAGCPSTTDTTTATTDTSTGTTGSTTGTTGGTTTGTTGDSTGSGSTTGSTTGTSGTSSSGSMSADVGGSTAPSKPGNGIGRTNHTPDECNYVDTCSAGGYSDAGGSSTSTTTDSTTGSSGSVPGSTDSTGTTTGTDCTKNNCTGQDKKTGTGSSSSYANVGGSTPGASSGSIPGSSTSTAPTKYKCAKDKDGNRVCESLPTCVAGSHPAKCGACVPDGESDDCVSPAEGGCWVTGGGFIEGPNLVTGAAEDGHDNFGGNAKPMKDGRVQGHWNHVDHGTGNHAKGVPSYIVCRHVDEPGPGGPGAKKGFIMNQVYFGGPAQWDEGSGWQDGYWFDVVAKDHGEPGSQPSPKNGFMVDTYHFTIRKQDDPTHQASGTVVYATKGGLVGGNIQMHPPNTGHPYTPMSLPSWVSYEP